MTGILLCAVAAANVFLNGDCEQVSMNVKASSSALMHSLREGWEYEFGPIAFFPKGWWPNGEPGVFRVIDASEDDEKRPYVHSGNRAFLLKTLKAKTTGAYNQVVEPKAGTYEISFWTRGTGSARLLFAAYDNTKHLASENPGLVSKPSEGWVENRFTAKIGVTPGTVRMSPILIVTNGEVYFDDFSMKEVRQ